MGLHIASAFEMGAFFDHNLGGFHIAVQNGFIAEHHFAHSHDISLNMSSNLQIGTNQFALDFGTRTNSDRSVGLDIPQDFSVNHDIAVELDIPLNNRIFADYRIDGSIFLFRFHASSLASDITYGYIHTSI